jgi:peptidoglycan/LPS O-acetylase OafA/YrhL
MDADRIREPGDRPPNTPLRKRILAPPSSRLGRWSATLMAIFVLLFMINSFAFMPAKDEAPWRQSLLPFYGIATLLCGLAAGALALVAVMRRHERSWLAWFGALVLFLLLGEFLVPH